MPLCGSVPGGVRLELDVIVPHWVGEKLQTPLGGSVSEAQWAEGGTDGDCDLENGCADSNLECRAPLCCVSGVLSEAAQSCPCVPRA